MVESFWTIPDVSQVRTPLSILREQAAALTEQTNGTLVGVAQTDAVSAGELRSSLSVSVPALNNYRLRVLTYYQPIEMYPGRLTDIDDRLVRIPDEDSFIQSVKEILSSDRVRRIIASLLAQSQEA